MQLSNILFTGMDITKETDKMLKTVESSCTNGMTESERKAYNMGVSNTISALGALLDDDEHLVFHLKNQTHIEEFNISDMLTVIKNKYK